MRMFSFLATAAFLLTSHAAFAACELEPTTPVPILPQMVGKTVKEAVPPEYLQGLKAKLPTCSEAEIVQAFLAVNNWQPDTRLQEGATIRAVKLKTVAPASAPAPAAAPAPAPAAAPAPPAAVAPVEVTQVREEQARVQTQKADLERAVQTFLRNNPIRAEWTPAQLASFTQAQSKIAEHDRKIKALDGRLTSLESRMTTLEGVVVDKADQTYVDTQLGTKANVGDSYTKEEIDTKLENLPAGEGLSWWAKFIMAVCAIGAILGAWAFFRKTPMPEPIDTSDFVTKAELDAVKDDVDDVREQGGFKVIMLEHDWYQKVLQLAEGDEQGLKVFLDGKPSYTILVKRDLDDTAFILAGVAGQVGSNAVKVGNLQSIVRKAAKSDNFRLNNPISLAAVA